MYKNVLFLISQRRTGQGEGRRRRHVGDARTFTAAEGAETGEIDVAQAHDLIVEDRRGDERVGERYLSRLEARLLGQDRRRDGTDEQRRRPRRRRVPRRYPRPVAKSKTISFISHLVRPAFFFHLFRKSSRLLVGFL